jgi:predicted RNA-binding Zn-ribbon protein involved in translation (DUF1610 family)
MLNGYQFIKMLGGELKIDEQLLAQKQTEFKRDYPYGIITINRKGFSIKVETKDMKCMKCGMVMNNRVNQHRKKGQWFDMVKKDNVSNWECPNCFPNGGAPIIILASIGK